MIYIICYLAASIICTLGYIAGAALSRNKWYEVGSNEGYARGLDRGIDIGWNQGREYQLELTTQPRRANGQFLSRGRR